MGPYVIFCVLKQDSQLSVNFLKFLLSPKEIATTKPRDRTDTLTTTEPPSMLSLPSFI